MGHIDRTLTDLDSMKEISALGVTLEFDLFGMEVCTNLNAFCVLKSYPLN